MQNKEDQLVPCSPEKDAEVPEKPVSTKKRKLSPEIPENSLYLTCPKRGCGKEISKRNLHRFVNHLEIHAGLYPFVCPHCEFGYETEIKLMQHVAMRHPPKEPIFECQCGQKYKTERFLVGHKKRFGH